MSNWNNFSIDKLSGAETFRELSTSGLYFIDMKKLFQKQMNKRPNKRRFVFVVAIVIGAAVLAVALIINHTGGFANNKCGGRGSDTFYKNAADVLQKMNQEDMQNLITEVEKQDGFTKDQNCLYALVSSELYLNQVPSAISHMQQLDAVYDSSEGFSKEFQRPNFYNYDQLKETVAVQKKVKETFNGNILLF